MQLAPRLTAGGQKLLALAAPQATEALDSAMAPALVAKVKTAPAVQRGGPGPWQVRALLLQAKPGRHSVASRAALAAAAAPLGPARAASQLAQAGVDVMDSAAALPR